MDTVRILKYPKDHINAYARVESTDIVKGTVRVTNMNMPFMGTFVDKEFKLDEVEFIKM
jgi:hypothetical protein